MNREKGFLRIRILDLPLMICQKCVVNWLKYWSTLCLFVYWLIMYQWASMIRYYRSYIMEIWSRITRVVSTVFSLVDSHPLCSLEIYPWLMSSVTSISVYVASDPFPITTRFQLENWIGKNNLTKRRNTISTWICSPYYDCSLALKSFMQLRTKSLNPFTSISHPLFLSSFPISTFPNSILS